MASRAMSGKNLRASFERQKSVQTIATAGGVIVVKPIMEQVFKVSPNTFGTTMYANGADLMDTQRIARTVARLGVGVVIGAVGMASKNDIARGLGFGVGVGALVSIMKDWGVDL